MMFHRELCDAIKRTDGVTGVNCRPDGRWCHHCTAGWGDCLSQSGDSRHVRCGKGFDAHHVVSNAVEHSVICANKGTIDIDSLPQGIRRYSQETPNVPASRQRAMIYDEHSGDDAMDQPRAELLAALKKARGRKAIAAQLLGIDRTILWRKMQKTDMVG